MIKQIPNMLSLFRLIASVILIFIEPLTQPFFVLYTLAGISDALDGTIARVFKLTSELGAKLDSIADLTFYAVMLIKVFPILFEILPKWIWIVVAAVVLIRIASYAVAAFRYRKFASLHTYFNKLCSVAMFFVPYFIKLSFGNIYCMIVCGIAAIGSTEELFVHIFSKDYDCSKKTIIKKA